MTIDFIICGLEHSGTTVVSDIFRQHDGCDSGFECGVLLCDRHVDFINLEPFAKNILDGWGITPMQLKEACSQPTLDDFYEHLYISSSLTGISNAHIRFDKTPRYITNLKSIHEKMDVPILAVTKDLRSTVASDFKRSKLDVNQYDDWYKKYLPAKKRYLKKVYEGYEYSVKSPKCQLVRLEDLCFDSKSTLSKMFKAVGLAPKFEYFIFNNARTFHTRGTSLNQMAGLSLFQLPPKIRDRIYEDFSEFELMFYDFNF